MHRGIRIASRASWRLQPLASKPIRRKAYGNPFHRGKVMTGSVDIQIVSDLHLETPLLRPRYDTFHLPVAAPHLALLGDIGKVNQPGLFTFLKKQLQKYKTVFYLLGNHEAYRDEHEYSSFSRARELLRTFERDVNTQRLEPDVRHGQFVFLERARFDFPGTNKTILGCTLFSHIQENQQDSVTLRISDFSAFGPGSGHIDDWDTATHTQAHLYDLAWLNTTVMEIERESPSREVVILTHYSPTRLQAANDPIHLEDRRQVNSAFVTDLSKESCWNSTVVKLWAFGHTHYNCDFVTARSVGVGNPEARHMRVLANQRGYFRAEEAPGFDEGKFVTLGVGMFKNVPLEGDANFCAGRECSDRWSESE